MRAFRGRVGISRALRVAILRFLDGLKRVVRPVIPSAKHHVIFSKNHYDRLYYYVPTCAICVRFVVGTEYQGPCGGPI